ncbi:hypothetical protein [Nocardia nova]|uniref:hypothetical protein n=1 Tax=Nocardia nova TaxID=37330 RepID=UPI0018961452|nr:hypothetical protein [Nocardia nova]MBF6277073.1 hypothetical protein [Nocardia nova]
MGSQLNRVDIIPSADWSVVSTSGRLVWAAIMDDLIATYWHSTGDEAEGYYLIRTDTLPDTHSVVGVPPDPFLPYTPRSVDLPGAYPFINSEVFLWAAKVPAVPDYAIEGVAPAVTYPLNRNIAPATGE